MHAQTTLDRVVPYWETQIAPEVRAGKRVIIAAHGKSILARGPLCLAITCWACKLNNSSSHAPRPQATLCARW